MRPETKLLAIKLLHTFIWLVLVVAIGYVLWSGFSGNVTTYSWLAVVSIIFEGLILLLFKGFCPLTVIARKYSNSEKANFDIFLPNWLARYNKQIFTTLFLIGLLLMIVRHFNLVV